MRDYPLHYEERAAVLRRMLNEDSLRVFPKMTEKQRTFIRRMMSIAEGSRSAVPRRHLRCVRIPRRSP